MVTQNNSIFVTQKRMRYEVIQMMEFFELFKVVE